MDASTQATNFDVLLAIVGQLLETSDLDADSNFIEEGGSSIQAVELDEIVAARFGKKLDFQVLYRCTLGELGDALFGRVTS